MPRALWQSEGGGLFLMSEVPLEGFRECSAPLLQENIVSFNWPQSRKPGTCKTSSDTCIT